MPKDFNYPYISEALIKCLERDFPDKLPREEISPYKLGILIGQQIIIDKLRSEVKEINEEE